MPDPFTREERNLTVWQRLRIALDTADGAILDNGLRGLSGEQKDIITRVLHGYVVREREDARRTNA